MPADVCRHCCSSRPYAPRTLPSPHPSILFPVRAFASTSTNRHSFVGICLIMFPNVFENFVFSFVLGLPSVGAQATTRLTSTLSPVNSKRIDIRRWSTNWWVLTDLRHIVFFTVKPTPCSPCLPSVSSYPKQKTLYPAAENSFFPGFLVSCWPTKSQPSCRAFASTHSARPVPVSAFHSQGPYVVGSYRHERRLLCRSSLAGCKLASRRVVRLLCLFFVFSVLFPVSRCRLSVF